MPSAPVDLVRRRVAAQIVAVFNDRASGEAPVRRQPDASWFGPSSVTWKVHGDVVSMMAGGVASLLLQMLHPAVLAGVWDHSNFRADMHGRLRRTARFIATTTYASEAEARAAIDRVRGIHGRVGGMLPDGRPYQAQDPALLAWVHVTETWSFLKAWRRYVDPAMSAADQDRYFDEMARVGEALGADPVPRTLRAAEALIQSSRGQLAVDTRTREVARLVLGRASGRATPGVALLMEAGVDLLPGWARAMHGLPRCLPGPLVRGATALAGGIVRWSFR